MEKFIEKIKIKIEEDRKIIVDQKNYEMLYVIELTKMWIEKNVNDQEDFSERKQALGNILNSFEFQEAFRLNKEMFHSGKIDEAKCEEILSLILRLSENEMFLENAPKVPYKIIDEFRCVDKYKTDGFIVHANIITKFWEYLCELEKCEADS